MMLFIPEIIDQHAEESSFLWLLRNAAVGEPHYRLADLAQLDERVEANLDGLRIAGERGWTTCSQAMGIGEPGEVFAAGVLAFEAKVPERMDAVLAAVVKSPELQSALCSALGWIDFALIADAANKMLGSDLAFLKRIALSAYAIHRQDPGPVLAKHILHDDPGVRSRALKAAGELGRLDLLPLALECLGDGDDKCRFYAAWSATLLGDAAGLDILKTFVQDRSVYATRACDLVVRKMNPADALGWLNALARQEETITAAIQACGALGDPQAVEWLIGMMHNPVLARRAGEAFSMMTGADIALEDLEGERPEAFASGPTEDPGDEDVDPDPDEDLPWPEPDLVRKWWDDMKGRFRGGERYLAGKPVSLEICSNILAGGFQRQRTAAALEIAMMTAGRPLFETRAPGFLQQSRLGAGR